MNGGLYFDIASFLQHFLAPHKALIYRQEKKIDYMAQKEKRSSNSDYALIKERYLVNKWWAVKIHRTLA